MPANAAIYYHPEGFDTSHRQLMGRHAAGEAFLRGYASHGDVRPFYCFARHQEDFADFQQRIAQLSGADRPTVWIPHTRPGELAEPGCLFVPGPTSADLAWQRRHLEPRAYSLCGVTHTIASAAVMDMIGDLMIAPFEPWDALICTSHAVKATVDHVLEHWGAYLDERTGGRARAPLELPVIPLGVDCDRLSGAGQAERWRNTRRAQHGIAADDIVVLFVGRLSYHAKAHPLPMYLGLEAAARRSRHKIHLIQAGWFANAAIEDAFAAAARAHCPSVNAIFLDGRDPEIRETVWFAADIFTSLSDNIQETFGLTPLEAMAAGLPVVVTDWNGYRDTVRDGETGFCVPTVMPPPGLGRDIAFRHAAGIDSYDRYLGHASLCTSVDAEPCAAAYGRLIENKDLRRTMGAAGRRFARDRFDWRVVIAAYQELWQTLAERRQAAAPRARAPAESAHPLRADPFALFAGYPTTRLGTEATIRLVAGRAGRWFTTIRDDPIVSFAPYLFLPPKECEALLSRLEELGACSLETLLQPLPAARRALAQRTVAWLAKLNIVQVSR